MARMVKATVEGSWGRYWYVRLAVPNAGRITLASFGSDKLKARSFRDAWNVKYALDFNADVLQDRIDYRELLRNAADLAKTSEPRGWLWKRKQ